MKRAHEKSRSDEQQKAQGDLRNNHALTQTKRAAGHTRRLLFESGSEIGTPKLEDGRHGKKQACEKRQREIERENARIGTGGKSKAGGILRPHLANQQGGNLRSDENAYRTAAEAQNQTLDQHLLKHAASRCSKCITNRNFSGSRSGTHQQQGADVGARHENDESSKRHRDDEHGRNVVVNSNS